jgi:ribonuclease-3
MQEPSSERANEIRDFLRRAFSIETDDLMIYDEALTHSSHGFPNNQRLAVLGDRVLSFIIAEHLYHKHPDFEKGRLDHERQNLDANSNLARIAREMGFAKPMVFGKSYQDLGIEKIESKEREMAEVFEALFGAIYIQQGLEKAREIALKLLF